MYLFLYHLAHVKTKKNLKTIKKIIKKFTLKEYLCLLLFSVIFSIFFVAGQFIDHDMQYENNSFIRDFTSNDILSMLVILIISYVLFLGLYWIIKYPLKFLKPKNIKILHIFANGKNPESYRQEN